MIVPLDDGRGEIDLQRAVLGSDRGDDRGPRGPDGVRVPVAVEKGPSPMALTASTSNM